MIVLIILMAFSSTIYTSSPRSEVASPTSLSSADSEIVAEAVSQLFNDDDGYIRGHIKRCATRVVEDDSSSPIRNEPRGSSFSLDNHHDRNYAHNVAIRASEMVMSDLRQKADRKWSKKHIAGFSTISSLISSAIVLAITLLNKG